MSIEPGSFPANSVYGGPYQYPSDLPLGEWNMMANGRIFQLDLQSISGLQVQGTISSGDFLNGKWSGTTGPSLLGVLTFVRVTQIKQYFTGYLMHHSERDPLWRIAGTYETKDGSGKGCWYATLPRK
ncbi:MAG: hypothetical protein AAF604_19940 [Acidobacteriota bacterium]